VDTVGAIFGLKFGKIFFYSPLFINRNSSRGSIRV
jgi:hypothetical protein